jgi:hypothetical protein
MLFGGECDIQVIDTLAPDDLRRFVEGPEERQAAISKVIAGCPIVHEPDNLIPELPMLENLVRDEPAQLARSGDENLLEPDAGAPAAFQHLAHQLARGVGERHVEDQKHRPGQLRDLERRIRRDIGLHIQRRDDTEDDCQDAAHEHREEIVHARAAAPQPVEPLEKKPERHDGGDERQHVDVLLERRYTLGDWNQPAVKPEEVSQHERDQAEQRVRHDVEGHQQPVVPDHRG